MLVYILERYEDYSNAWPLGLFQSEENAKKEMMLRIAEYSSWANEVEKEDEMNCRHLSGGWRIYSMSLRP